MTTDEANEVPGRVPLGPALEECGPRAGAGSVPPADQARALDVLKHYADFCARRRARPALSISALRRIYPDDDDAYAR